MSKIQNTSDHNSGAVQADFARHTSTRRITHLIAARQRHHLIKVLLNTRRDNVTIPGLNSRRFVDREREERALGLNGMHKIGHRWMGTAETKGTSSSFIVVLGLGEEMVELRLHAHPLYIVLRHVRVRPVAARGAFA